MRKAQFVVSVIAVVALVVMAVTGVLILREQRQQTCFGDIEAAVRISEFAVQTAKSDTAIAEAQRDRDTLLNEVARTQTGCR